jgi:hypothetical protein
MPVKMIDLVPAYLLGQISHSELAPLPHKIDFVLNGS